MLCIALLFKLFNVNGLIVVSLIFNTFYLFAEFWQVMLRLIWTKDLSVSNIILRCAIVCTAFNYVKICNCLPICILLRFFFLLKSHLVFIAEFWSMWLIDRLTDSHIAECLIEEIVHQYWYQTCILHFFSSQYG